MKFRRYITLVSVLLLSVAVMLMNAQAQLEGQIIFGAQVPPKAQIAFQSDRDGDTHIYVMDANGGNLRRLTDDPAFDYGQPTWSPDGREIAFVSFREGNVWLGTDIYVMDANGGNLRRLTDDPAFDYSEPAWSPDGREIAFASKRDGNFNIYVMDTDGRNVRRLTDHPGWDAHPTWFDPSFAYPVSPAGKLATRWGWLKRNCKQ